MFNNESIHKCQTQGTNHLTEIISHELSVCHEGHCCEQGRHPKDRGRKPCSAFSTDICTPTERADHHTHKYTGAFSPIPLNKFVSQPLTMLTVFIWYNIKRQINFFVVCGAN